MPYPGRANGPPGPGPPPSWSSRSDYQYQQHQHQSQQHQSYWPNPQNGAYSPYWGEGYSDGYQTFGYNSQQSWTPQSTYPTQQNYGYGGTDYGGTPATSQKDYNWDYARSTNSAGSTWKEPWSAPFKDISSWTNSNRSNGARSNSRAWGAHPAARPPRPYPPPPLPTQSYPPQPCPPPMCPPPYSPPRTSLCPPLGPPRTEANATLSAVQSSPLPPKNAQQDAAPPVKSPAAKPPAAAPTEIRANDTTASDALKKISQMAAARYQLASPRREDDSPTTAKKSRWDVKTPTPKTTREMEPSEKVNTAEQEKLLASKKTPAQNQSDSRENLNSVKSAFVGVTQIKSPSEVADNNNTQNVNLASLSVSHNERKEKNVQTDVCVSKPEKKISNTNLLSEDSRLNACEGITRLGNNVSSNDSILPEDLRKSSGIGQKKKDKLVEKDASSSKPEQKAPSNSNVLPDDLGKSNISEGNTRTEGSNVLSNGNPSSEDLGSPPLQQKKPKKVDKHRDSSVSKPEKKASESSVTAEHSCSSSRDLGENSSQINDSSSLSNTSQSLPKVNSSLNKPHQVIASSQIPESDGCGTSKSKSISKTRKHDVKKLTGHSSKSSTQACAESLVSKERAKKANPVSKETSNVKPLQEINSDLKKIQKHQSKKESCCQRLEATGGVINVQSKTTKQKIDKKSKHRVGELFSPDVPKTRSGTAKSVGTPQFVETTSSVSPAAKKNVKKSASVYYPPKFNSDFRIPKKIPSSKETLPNPFNSEKNKLNTPVQENTSKADTWLQKGTNKNNIPSGSAMSTRVAPISLSRRNSDEYWSVDKPPEGDRNSSVENSSKTLRCEVEDILEGRTEINLAEEVQVARTTAKRYSKSVISTPKSSKRRKAGSDDDDEWTPRGVKSVGRRSRRSSNSSKPTSPVRSGVASRTRSRTRSPSRQAENPFGFSKRYSSDEEESDEETPDYGSNWTCEGITNWLHNANTLSMADQASVAACKSRLMDIAQKKKIFNQNTQNYVSVNEISQEGGREDLAASSQSINQNIQSNVSVNKISQGKGRENVAVSSKTMSSAREKKAAPSNSRNALPSTSCLPENTIPEMGAAVSISATVSRVVQEVDIVSPTIGNDILEECSVPLQPFSLDDTTNSEEIEILEKSPKPDQSRFDIEEINLEESPGPINVNRPLDELWKCVKENDRYHIELLEDNLKLAISSLSSFIQNITEAETLKTKRMKDERYSKLRQDFVLSVTRLWEDTKETLNNICRSEMFSSRDLFIILRKKLTLTNDLSDPQSFVGDLEELYLLVTTPSMMQLKRHCGDKVTMAAKLYLLHKTKGEYLNQTAAARSSVQVDVAAVMDAEVMEEIPRAPSRDSGISDFAGQMPVTNNNSSRSRSCEQDVVTLRNVSLCVWCSASAKIRCSSCEDIFFCTTTCQLSHWQDGHYKTCRRQ